MKEPLPTKSKPAAADRPPAPRPAPAAEVRVLARFYRRMKPQRVFPLVVELQGAAGGGLAAPVFIHPHVPGAHVTPSELTLDPAADTPRATFYVTPLAKGKLAGARLDVFYQGRLLQELPLHMRSVTQCLTWVLAALTVLVPAFLIYWTVYHPLSGFVARTSVVPAEAVEPADKPAGEDQKARPDDRGKGPPREVTIAVPLGPGEVLERQINYNVPDLPSTVTVPWRDEPMEMPFTVTRPIAAGLGTVYTYLETMKHEYASFWIGVVLLGLTVASAVTHKSARARRRTKPLVLAPS